MKYFLIFIILVFSCKREKNNSNIKSKINLKIDSCSNIFVNVEIQNDLNRDIYFFPPRIVFKDSSNVGKYIFFRTTGYPIFNKTENKYFTKYVNKCLENDVTFENKNILNSLDTTKFDTFEKYGLKDLLFIKSGKELNYFEYLGNIRDTFKLNGIFYFEENMTKKFTGIKYLPKTLGGYQLFLDEIKSDTLRVELY